MMQRFVSAGLVLSMSFPTRPSRHFIRMMDTDGREKFACQKCGKLFLYQCNLLRHRKQCEGDFHLHCPYCERKFYRRDKYQYHLMVKHGALDDKKGTFKSSSSS
ncbi:hypothetical protein ACOMHN_055151 [Nucella lapillus]